MQHALIIGLGISGQAAAKLLLKRGYAVTAIEKNRDLLVSEAILSLKAQGLRAFPEQEMTQVSAFDLLVPSPGVPQEHPLYALAVKRGVPIIGEAELAFRQMHQPAVAITGTNGKTTVTLLAQHLLNKSGKPARALGNVGEPLSTYFLEPKEEIVVAELSSFQLETMQSAVFDAAALLNITPDHLDRYAGMREYAAAKCRLQACVKAGKPFYVHENVVQEYSDLIETEALRIFGRTPSCHAWTDKAKIYEQGGVEYLLPARYTQLGNHESENALAAWLLVKPFGVSFEQFVQGLESFQKPPHRIEFVKRVEGVDYFDDSKGTNLDATIQAVLAMSGPTILIAGGVDKGAPYTAWIDVFRGRVKKILAIGAAAKKIERELASSFAIELVDSLQNAVGVAQKEAKKGDCVLLSPGCSSYDMFRNYAHRGEEFKRCVEDLKNE